MALPVISAITFDQATYEPGDMITATVHYSNPNVTGTDYPVDITVTDDVTGEFAQATASYTVGVPNTSEASVTGGQPGQFWTKVSDDGKSVAVFTATAIED